MRRRNLTPFRYLAFGLEIVLLLVLQSTPKLIPELFGATPLLLFAAALSFAAAEKVIPAVILGAVCGVLTDLSADGGVGFYAIALTLICFGVSSLLHTKLRTTLFSLMVLAAAAVPLAVGLYFVLFRLFAGTPGAGALFVHHYLARMGYTYLCILPLYPLNRWLHGRLC